MLFHVEIKGYDTALKNAVEFEAVIMKGVVAATKSIVEHWNTEAKKSAPVRTGYLVSKMQAFPVAMSGKVAISGVGTVGVPYAVYVHEGGSRKSKFYEKPMYRYAAKEWVLRYQRWINLRLKQLSSRVKRAT